MIETKFKLAVVRKKNFKFSNYTTYIYNWFEKNFLNFRIRIRIKNL